MWRDFVMDKSGAGASFLRELRFPLPIYIPSASPQSSLSSEAGTIGQEWPQCHSLTNQIIIKKLRDVGLIVVEKIILKFIIYLLLLFTIIYYIIK
jgi:hypothetical protein